MTASKRTMTLNLSDAEMSVLEELCEKKELNKTAIIRQALKLYQIVESRLEKGDKLFFEDDKTKEKAEVMML
jgi:predicted transcriptional regulator